MMRSVVKAQYVREVLAQVQLIDASWHMPSALRNARQEFNEVRIPGAMFFDLDECVGEPKDLPHMMPKPEDFERYLTDMGVAQDKPIVIYDSSGVFSGPRLWYMLQSMGVRNVAVMDGGLPKWKALGFPLEVNAGPPKPVVQEKPFKGKFEPSFFTTASKLLELVESDQANGRVIDARSAERFTGTVDEPRPGLLRGHIPGSLNVPFTELLVDGSFRPKEEMTSVFNKHGVDPFMQNMERTTYFSCGSGVTACIPLLALVEYFGWDINKISLFDGAYAEWGNGKFPVEVTATLKKD